jgi:hypothetical protein
LKEVEVLKQTVEQKNMRKRGVTTEGKKEGDRMQKE